MMKIYTRILLICSIVLLWSCKEDDLNLDENQNPSGSTEMNDQVFRNENFGGLIIDDFIGVVKDESGNKLSDVQVTAGNIMTHTDANGVFILRDAEIYENFAFIKAEKEGFINGSKVLIPNLSGINQVHITLVEREVIATVSSGSPSQVILASGAKIDFSGDFITSSGNVYDGEVNVVTHHLQVDDESILNSMPGNLFAQSSNNSARFLETYGMLSVELFSPSGEVLNIEEDSPATIHLPIHDSQLTFAPENIALWYFDEEQGYWKEEGEAEQSQNYYVGQVSHFTWWNCDFPLDFVELCFSINSGNDSVAQYFVEITSESSNQIVYAGYLGDDNIQCGLIPQNQDMLVSVYGASEYCFNQLVHSQIIGGYSEDGFVDISFLEENNTTTIIGMAVNCDNEPIANGYAYVNQQNIYNIENGVIDFTVVTCEGTSEIDVVVYDYDTDLWTDVAAIPVEEGQDVNIGTILTCEDIDEVYNGSVVLSTQEEVDAFGLYGYTSINGSLTINGNSSGSTITDLTSLSSLTSISDNLYILGNSFLTSLEGLNNITSVSRLRIVSNDILDDLSGLNNLASVSLLFIGNNNSLSSLDGLDNLINAEGVNIGRDLAFDTFHPNTPNPNLSDFCALQNLFTNGTYQEEPSGIFEIYGVTIVNNLYNPDVQSIISGNCSQ